MRDLKLHCIHHVAKEIARLRVKGDAGEWPSLTTLAMPEAIEKINAMSNIELLDLISAVENQDD
jgi:hypothetical protein